MKRFLPFAVFFALFTTGCMDSEMYDLVFYSVSDPHVIDGATSDSWRLQKSSGKILTDVVEKINSEKPHLVVIPGDLTESHEKDAVLSAGILAKLKMPWFVVPGNHDVKTRKARKSFGEAFKGHGPEKRKMYWRYDVPGKKITFIGLDSSYTAHPQGSVDGGQVAWIEDVLKKMDDDRYVVVIIHHPPALFYSKLESNKKLKYVFYLSQGDFFRNMFKKYKVVKLVVSGHTHTRGYYLDNGVHYVSTPSINSWPNMYTRYEISKGEIRYRNEWISDKALVEKAKKSLFDQKSEVMSLDTDKEMIRGFFMNGPVEDTLSLRWF